MKVHRYLNRIVINSIISFSLLLLMTSTAEAVIRHQYDFDTDGSDSVGTADLTLIGNASVSGGELVLTNTTGGPRTENAQATGASLTELASTINGTSELSILIRYNTTSPQAWSKIFMAGDGSEFNFIDITPHRGNPNGDIGMTFRLPDPVNQQITTIPTDVTGDAYAIGVWSETTDSITLYSMEDGNSATFGSSVGSMNGGALSGLGINEFYLGSAVFYGDGDYAGNIDKVEIYDHALSELDVFSAVGFTDTLTLEVNTTTGELTVKNNSSTDFSFDYYEIASETSSLSESGWTSFDSQGIGGGLDGDYNTDGSVDAADYTVWRDGDSPDSSQAGYDLWVANYGNSGGASSGSWTEAGGSSDALLAELLLEGEQTIAAGGSLSLGFGFDTVGSSDLTFKLGSAGNPLLSGFVTYSASSSSTAVSVPEPVASALLIIGIAGFVQTSRRS